MLKPPLSSSTSPSMTLRLQATLRFALSSLLVFAIVAITAGPSLAQQAATPSVLNPRDYGAVADCKSHPLGSAYPSLAAARAVYPFVTSLSQQLDYVAIKAASNAAFGADGEEHAYLNRALNRPLYIPGGCYNLGDDTWVIRNGVGLHIYGAGRLTTRVVSNNTAFRTDGFWYSMIQGIEFASLTKDAIVTVDIDGNVPGHPYETRGVQANSFSDLLITAGGSRYGLALNRLGFSGAQGDHNDFWNCHFSNASFALYYQNGFNALNNTFHGGDFQNYTKHAIYLVAGSVNLFSPTFESSVGYTQILNDGWDIDASSAGVSDEIIVDGARTESLRFYHGAFSQYAIIRGLNQTPAINSWTPTTAYQVNGAVIGVTPLGNRLYRVTGGGTSAASEPHWPASGTVNDGSVTWTETDFEVVHLDAGVLRDTARIVVGRLKLADNNQELKTVEVRADYVASLLDDLLLVDSTSRNIVVTLPAAFAGKTYTVKKWDTTAHTVTVHSVGPGNAIDLTGDVIIPGGSRGYVTVTKAGGNNLAGAYWIVGKSF
jgi:hypothetical protein